VPYPRTPGRIVLFPRGTDRRHSSTGYPPGRHCRRNRSYSDRTKYPLLRRRTRARRPSDTWRSLQNSETRPGSTRTGRGSRQNRNSSFVCVSSVRQRHRSQYGCSVGSICTRLKRIAGAAATPQAGHTLLVQLEFFSEPLAVPSLLRAFWPTLYRSKFNAATGRGTELSEFVPFPSCPHLL
jgi:hypothetical protein